MPFIVLFCGVVLILTGLRGTTGQLGTLLKGDLATKNGFGTWLLAFFLVGAIGFVPRFKLLSNALQTLLIVVILLSNKGFFAALQQAVQSSGTGTAIATNTGTSLLPQTTGTAAPSGNSLVLPNVSLPNLPFQPTAPNSGTTILPVG